MLLMPVICLIVAEGAPQMAGSGPLQGQLPPRAVAGINRLEFRFWPDCDSRRSVRWDHSMWTLRRLLCSKVRQRRYRQVDILAILTTLLALTVMADSFSKECGCNTGHRCADRPMHNPKPGGSMGPCCWCS